ncbi:hypothetical protein DM02DRAFT_355491 [Periconia macrospinosa]|uniref:Uncharacterized protein n=1 Tax=Periconia macrospinosa TaxID=97972 RepID=A0A2V1E988_9PLEO|nr:hypothetical protein DM02DRAFT_355491 [Periconia macrospinosa]
MELVAVEWICRDEEVDILRDGSQHQISKSPFLSFLNFFSFFFFLFFCSILFLPWESLGLAYSFLEIGVK